jgi:AraC-like DNA-binding protein
MCWCGRAAAFMGRSDRHQTVVRRGLGGTTVLPAGNGIVQSSAQRNNARYPRYKEDIVRNLELGDVSVAAVAARHRVSPRYLRKLFESEGVTFTEYVLDRRLELAHRLLCDPRRASEKIASVAFAAGFGDVSYFYRAFRRRYDLLPTDVRAQARGLH